VGFTYESAIRVAELRELVREPLELFPTPPAWTLKHLREVQTRVMNDRAGLAADGIEVTVTSIRERDNIVEIGLSTEGQRAKRDAQGGSSAGSRSHRVS
jgi:hypothetical protein